MNEANPAPATPLAPALHEEETLATKLSAGLQRVQQDPTPRWPAIIAALSVGGLTYALPESLQVGPRWILLVIVGVLIVPASVTFHIGKHHTNQFIGYALSTVLTVALCLYLAQLITFLPTGREKAPQLLHSAAALWMTNVLVFALWYWRLDGGGPHQRDARATHTKFDGAILFPQMTLDGCEEWTPQFVDYLFLAFNTSTAFSPTDAPILSRWAKCLMMVQSLVSLLILALLAARAINILPN